MPKVSVITPVYNGESYIEKCINSILRQSYSDFELLLVDDGSTDSTGDICDMYQKKDNRIKVIHKKNGGQGMARNVALDISVGEYISFVDADDTVTENMIETMINAIQEENADIALCGITLYDGIRIQYATPYAIKTVISGDDIMREYITTNHIHRGPCNKMFRRELFEHIRFPSLRAHEDAYIMHNLFGSASAVVCLPEALYIQFVRAGSTETASFSEKKLSALDVSVSYMEYCEKNYFDLYCYVAYHKADTYLDLLRQILYSFSRLKYKELYHQLYNEMKVEHTNVSKKYPRAKKSDKVLYAINHPHLFEIKMFFYASEIKIKSFIKSMLTRWKS